ncbi:lecithin retinol acyltransferase family protein [Shewanella algae]|uniref:lecithin retinol acyltransferase family protein n=1 Tax=Shewanella algae TaxID=38313 RepID=UPI001C5861F5|nr:lecithin retinol acyltransferase family protein [Shewanella algae]
MKEFKAGDHLVTNIDPLGITKHHGLYTGDGMVIHQAKSGIIEEVPIEIFSDGNEVRVKRRVPSPRKAIDEARRHLGEMHYQLFSDNCEHFVNKAADDRSTSNQVANTEHLALQAVARTGMIGTTAYRAVTSTMGTVALASTVSKMTGEYIGLPDNINTIIGTPGDLIAKPLETTINGIGRTLSDTAESLADGEYGSAVGKVAEGVIMVPLEATLSLAETGVNGARAVCDLIEDTWDWLTS